jgi:hypothetical protein
MPQLDSLTYFTQFFWFIIIFITFYIILSNIILPTIATILKVRNLLKSNKNLLDNVHKDNNILEIISNSNLNLMHNFINNLSSGTKIWYNNIIESINKKDLYNVNKEYINNIGLILLKKKIKI